MKCVKCGCSLSEDNAIFAPKSKKYYYFCLSCYKSSRYYNEETYKIFLNETQLKLQSHKQQSDLIDFVKKNIGIPDNRFMIKKCKINNGTFGTKQYPSSLISFKISDKELYDIFVKMRDYLRKMVSNVEVTQRVHYALAIVYNSFPKYLEYMKKVKNSQTVDCFEVCDELINKVCRVEEKNTYDIEF